jgi:hypothetical protein
MATMYAGPNNVFVPAFDTQAKLIVNYSRDPKKYIIINLMTITTVDKPIGKYMRIKPEVQGQVNSVTGQSSRWADGAPRPIMLETGQKFEWLEYFAERYVMDFPIGWATEENAVWDIVASQSGALANRLMSLRAYDFYTVLQDSGNYATGNTATATTAGGGKWDVATLTNRYIQKSLRYGVQAILKATMNAVTADDLILVVGPEVAGQMAESAEVADFIAQNPDAVRFLQGSLFEKQLSQFGLPPRLYGINVVVDPLVLDESALGATSSKTFVSGATTAYLIARPGSLNGNAGGSSFSFIHNFMWKGKEMETEVIDDPLNKRKILSVTEWRQIKAVATEAAFLFTEVVD